MKSVRPEALVLVLALTAPAGAAEITWPRLAYNPASEEADAPGDLVLPLPCKGAMVFRPVDVPGGKLFDDRRIVLGQRSPGRGFIESPRPEFLSGTFQGKDAWRYYIGKYEVTAAQYAAINSLDGGACPDPADDDGAFPAVSVTHAEANLAAERYSGWLFDAAPDALPQTGYLRLPTEAEWEFAARGGAAVSEGAFAARLPPMDGPTESHINYDRTDAELDYAGNLDPNPLGLHDMLGNAAELVHGLFRLNHVGRSHGRAGGNVRRGGSYRTPLERLHSGLRDEFAPLGPRGLRRDPATGFRLAIAAPALPDETRLKDLRRAWTDLSEGEKLELGPRQDNPKREVETLAAFARKLDFEGRDELERRILTLGDVIDRAVADQKAERGRAAREMLRVSIVAGLRLPADLRRMVRCEELMEINADRYRETCEKALADKDYNLDFYVDRLTVIDTTFTDRRISDEARTLKSELESRNLVAAIAALPRVLGDLSRIRRDGSAARPVIERGWQPD